MSPGRIDPGSSFGAKIRRAEREKNTLTRYCGVCGTRHECRATPRAQHAWYCDVCHAHTQVEPA